MRKFTCIITALVFMSGFMGYSQNAETAGAKSSPVTSEYDRNAITPIVLENNSEFMNDIRNATAGFIIPSKFDDNLINTRYFGSKSNNQEVRKTLSAQGIPNQILAKWFSRKENGEFDMTIIHDRGMYNATDDEVRRASGSKVGLAKLKDAGTTLINHSYILVLEYKDIEDVQKKYDKQDLVKKALAEKTGSKFEPVKRRKNGWEGDVKAYLYKLSFNDSVMGVFYDDLWIYEDDSPEVKAAKKAKFDQTQFPVTFVLEANASADGSQYNPGEILAPPVQLTRDELFKQMVNTGLTNIVFEAERKVEDFRVKTPLYGTSPLKAKVGKKEGLYTEQRYFVLEFEQNRKGETEAKRKGVIRTKKVVDNRQVATGSSELFTTFYQTAGRGLMDGMLLQQRNDFGLGISAGTAITGEMGGFYLKAEANVGALTGRIIDLGLKQVKVFGTAHFQTKEYTSTYLGVNPYEMSFTRLQVGISKGWYFARNFSFAPYISYGMETATNDDWITDGGLEDGQNIGTDFIAAGAFASMNLTYWMQLVGGVNYYIPFGDAYDKDRSPDLYGNVKYTDFFENRQGMSGDVGVRIEF
ncbi:MAG TPA: hypothetical protein DEQ03_01785 [Marinilabiliales bacterium]|nr:hypothetical protein [Marinilabiliales bacterium]